MFNIGFGEILLIAVVGLLVFGPDRLPDAVKRGSAMIRQLRDMASDARKQVVDASGMDEAETARVVADLRELHPRRIASSVLDPITDPPASGPVPSTGIDPDLT